MEQTWTSSVDWLPPVPTGAPALEEGQVHIWRLTHAAFREWVHRYLSLLSPAEHARADRYLQPSVRESFILTRGALRSLAGGYLSILPGEVPLVVGDGGKPHIDRQTLQGTIEFSASHAKGLSLFIFTRSQPVGIDVEYVDPAVEYSSIVRNFFASAEVSLIDSLEEGQQRSAFFALWNRKEALAKAIGSGIASGLVGVPLWGSQPLPGREVIATVGGSRWKVWNFLPGNGFSAAAAVQGEGWQTHYLDFCPQ
jgi:4'-phosphopantetheinyl transferase